MSTPAEYLQALREAATTIDVEDCFAVEAACRRCADLSVQLRSARVWLSREQLAEAKALVERCLRGAQQKQAELVGQSQRMGQGRAARAAYRLAAR